MFVVEILYTSFHIHFFIERCFLKLIELDSFMTIRAGSVEGQVNRSDERYLLLKVK